MSRLAGFVVLVSLTASAGTMPSVGLAEVRFRSVDFWGKNLKQIEKLRDGFYTEFMNQRGVAAVSRTLAESYLKDAERKDWADADDALVRFAVDRRIDAQYGMYVFAWLEEEGEEPRTYLKMRARVVGRAGSRARDLTVKVMRDAGPLAGSFKALTAQLFRELELSKLPVTSEAPPPPPVEPPMVLAPPTVPSSGAPGDEPPVATHVELRKSGSSVLPRIGYAGLGVGAVAAAVGAVVFATAPIPRTDALGLVVREDVGVIGPTKTQQGVGVGLMIGGGVVALAGGVLSYLSHRFHAPVGATVTVVPGAASVSIGGELQ